MNLGIDAAKSDQQVRGSTVMPHGTGKTLRVAVFTSGKNAELAKAAGADIVGLEDLAAQVKAGVINFDRVIASPDAMRVVGQLGQILGPRGRMPNLQVGTVTPDVATAVKNAKAGQVTYRVDKAGIVHCIIGQVEVRDESSQGKPPGADQRSQQGEAGHVQGHLPEEDHRELDHGCGCGGGPGVPRIGCVSNFEGLMRTRCKAGSIRDRRRARG